MSILITGGTGFIGAEVARQLLAAGEREIYVLHRSQNFQRLPDIAGQLHFLQADLAHGDQIQTAVATAKPHTIYHLGALLSLLAEADPQAAVAANAMGTYHLLEAARQQAVPQLLYASSLATYGAGIHEPVITDDTLQRPQLIYGITKLFGEQLGYYYKRKYGLDFRGLRYPSIIGPGVKSPGVVQYTSKVIEASAQGQPFTVTVTPETAVPVMYYKDAAQAIIQLGRAPLAAIQTINYLVDGPKPTPTAAQLVALVRQHLPLAQITFAPDPQIQPLLDQLLRPLDDTNAHREWGWRPAYDTETMVADFLAELHHHPERYV